MYDHIEKHLERRGVSTSTLNKVHNSKILIVDDKIQDLKSFTEGLAREGFTNITQWERIESINSVVGGNYDIVILDLAGIADGICALDGIGALAAIKDMMPALPVLVVSGSTATPEAATTLSRADLIRNKPILSADLAADVVDLLKQQKDPFWAGLLVLRELRRLDADIRAEVSGCRRIKLAYLKWSIERNILKNNAGIVFTIAEVGKTISTLASLASTVEYLVGKLGGE
jgi:CheY-like chemotaxis protein